MSVAVYQPRTDLRAKLVRRSARYLARRPKSVQLDRGLISLSFDDCPRSVFETALPLIEAKGWRATIYASMGLCDTTNHLGLHMSEADMVCAYEAGHEIADHSFSHLDAMTAGPSAMLSDIERNRDVFKRLGLPAATSFAYPYGEVTPSVKRALGREFALSRGIHEPSGHTLDLNLAASAKLYSSHLEDTLIQIERAARNRSWLILFGHDVRDDCSEFGCMPEELSTVLNRIESLGLDVATVGQGVERVTA